MADISITRDLAQSAPAGGDATRLRTTVDEGGAPHPKRPFKVWFRQTGWRHIIGLAMLVFAAFPLLYVLSASLNPGGTLVTANALFSNVSLGSYVELFNRPQQPYAAWFLNTLVIGLVSAAGTVLLAGREWQIALAAWQHPVQLAAAPIMILAGIIAVRARKRYTGVVLVSVTGLGMVVLFGSMGAPDLALTQVLVELVTVVTVRAGTTVTVAAADAVEL